MPIFPYIISPSYSVPPPTATLATSNTIPIFFKISVRSVIERPENTYSVTKSTLPSSPFFFLRNASICSARLARPWPPAKKYTGMLVSLVLFIIFLSNNEGSLPLASSLKIVSY